MERQYKMSQFRYDELQEELEYLKTTRRADVAEKIAEARELGDLAENEAYDAAKDEQRDMEARIKEVEEILRSAVIMDEFIVNGGVLLKYNYSDKDVVIPESVVEIEPGAFNGCSSLTNVTIPKNVTEIGDETFASCHSLISVTIPESVTRIGDYAFTFCKSLTCITIPESVRKIGVRAFADCSALSDVAIPGSVAEISPDIFENCTSLTSEPSWRYSLKTGEPLF